MPAGSQILLGAFAPRALAASAAVPSLAALSAQRSNVTKNPFTTEVAQTAAAATALKNTIFSSGGGLIFFLFFFFLAVQKFDSLGRIFNGCPRNPARFNWVKLDLFFGLAHTVPDGGALQTRQTSFGGMLSVVCLSAVFMLSASLAVDNYAPVYTTSITTELAPWQPFGTFRLTAKLHGSCTDSTVEALTCAATIAPENVGDWSGALNQTACDIDAADGTCTVVWECNRCYLTTLSEVTLQLRGPPRSWAHYVEYKWEVPRLNTAALTAAPASDTLPAFAVEGVIVAPGIETNTSALRGAPTTVNVLMTLFSIIDQSKTARVSYLPSTSVPLFGGTTSLANFAYHSTDSVGVDFKMTGNSFNIVKCVFCLAFSRFFVSSYLARS